jgi:branched-chain amino acid transport system permease protein
VSALQELDISKSRTFIFGLALVIMMLVRPEGLFPSTRRKMELHAAEESETEAAQERARVVDVDT